MAGKPQGLVAELSPDYIATVGAAVIVGMVINCVKKNSVLGSKVGNEEESLDMTSAAKIPYQNREVEIDASLMIQLEFHY